MCLGTMWLISCHLTSQQVTTQHLPSLALLPLLASQRTGQMDISITLTSNKTANFIDIIIDIINFSETVRQWTIFLHLPEIKLTVIKNLTVTKANCNIQFYGFLSFHSTGHTATSEVQSPLFAFSVGHKFFYLTDRCHIRPKWSDFLVPWGSRCSLFSCPKQLTTLTTLPAKSSNLKLHTWEHTPRYAATVHLFLSIPAQPLCVKRKHCC